MHKIAKSIGIISKISNTPKVDLPELVYYALSENNYYGILHNDNKRNFGNYEYSANTNIEDKATSIHYSLTQYIHEYDISCVTIDNKNIEILITQGDFVYKHILSNII